MINYTCGGEQYERPGDFGGWVRHDGVVMARFQAGPDQFFSIPEEALAPETRALLPPVYEKGKVYELPVEALRANLVGETFPLDVALAETIRNWNLAAPILMAQQPNGTLRVFSGNLRLLAVASLDNPPPIRFKVINGI